MLVVTILTSYKGRRLQRWTLVEIRLSFIAKKLDTQGEPKRFQRGGVERVLRFCDWTFGFEKFNEFLQALFNRLEKKTKDDLTTGKGFIFLPEASFQISIRSWAPRYSTLELYFNQNSSFVLTEDLWALAGKTIPLLIRIVAKKL